MRTLLASLLAMSTVLAGCAKPTTIDTSTVDAFIGKQTAYVIDEVADAAKYPNALASYDNNAVSIIGLQTPELFTVVDATWNGSLEQMTRKVARSLGYATAARGEKLPAPTIATVNAFNLPAIGFLRQGFAQGRGRLRLEVDTRRKVFTVIYARPEASPIPHQDDLQL